MRYAIGGRGGGGGGGAGLAAKVRLEGAPTIRLMKRKQAKRPLAVRTFSFIG
jgi:hypothetical protein